MGWYIYFTAEDLARTRIESSLGPLAETMLGVSMLRNPLQRSVAFRSWLRHAHGHITAEMKPLAALIPPGSRGIDLYTLTGRVTTIEQGIEALFGIPDRDWRAELRYFANHFRLPEWAWALTEGKSGSRQQLASGLRASYQVLVEPYWTRIDAHLLAERALRGRILLDDGIERVLSTLHPPSIRWRPPILEVNINCPDRGDLQLRGSGIVLVPSLFVGPIPVLLLDLADPSAAPTLIFPAAQDPDICRQLWNGIQPRDSALAALVGRTRAAALRKIVGGCTTSELARGLGISASSASEHAAVLRDAGLVSTSRHGGAALHTLTSLGKELLRDAP